MGGIAKGQIVREIDALGGYSAIVTDKSSIQYKMLNLSKGLHGAHGRKMTGQCLPRYGEMLESTPNLDFTKTWLNLFGLKMLSLAWSQVLAKKLNLSLSFLLTGLFSTDSFMLRQKLWRRKSR